MRSVVFFYMGKSANRFTSLIVLIASVFKRLQELESGDEIFVETSTGERLRYEVLKSETYPYNEAPLADIFNRSDGSFLNLITCRGEWFASRKMYDERLVVYAELQ